MRVTAWFGIVAPPARLPQPSRASTHEDRGVLNNRQVQERLLSLGVDRAPIDSPQEFADFLAPTSRAGRSW